jgi:hypothetical protein
MYTRLNGSEFDRLAMVGMPTGNSVASEGRSGMLAWNNLDMPDAIETMMIGRKILQR